MLILGCDSSCDDTSIALFKERVLSNIVLSQDHRKYGGVFPEYAAREHLHAISQIYDEALREANVKGSDIQYFAATYAPGLVNSLLVGFSFVKSLAYAFNRPFIPVHHIQGHIYAAFIENTIQLPALALVISGGHTSLIYVNEEHRFKEIGSTLDDAVGEVYDKIGRMLGFPFPAGKEIDALSKLGEANIRMPIPNISNYDFSFSGLKSFVFRLDKSRKENLCASFQKAVETILIEKSKRAFQEFKPKSFILAGGVAANTGIRKIFQETFDNLAIPSHKLCLDNGAMIAAAAKYYIEYNKVKDVLVKPNLKVDD